MEEASGGETSLAAGRSRRRTIGVGDFREGLVAALLDNRRIVELMTAIARSLAPKRAVMKQRGLAIAERHPPGREGADQPEQPKHFMGRARRVDQAAPKHHIAAALAMDRLQHGKPPDALTKVLRHGQSAGVQFWIAARQPTEVTIRRRRLVG
jgi:hypothetical protein